MDEVHGRLRALFDQISDYDGSRLFDDLLRPWLDGDGPSVCRWLGDLAGRSQSAIPIASDDELFDLYALSRVIDALLVNFQPLSERGSWSGPPAGLSPEQYAAFTAAIGLSEIHRPGFSPFFHEIVTVEQADGAPTIVHELWPALMLGGMLVSRAGVAVRADRRDIRKELAENSRMYWACRRRNRPRTDLSVGWGSNSQWRTRFRRDFCFAGSLTFNADGKNDLGQAAPPGGEGLSVAERIELLTHRCFVRCDKDDSDLWPYDDRLSVPVESDRGSLV